MTIKNCIIMKTIITSIFLITLFFQASQAQVNVQDTVRHVPIIAYWDQGDTFKFKVIKKNTDSVDHKLVKHEERAYIAQFIVLDSLEDGYRIEWKIIENLNPEKKDIPEDLLLDAMALNNSQIIFKTDTLGRFLEIENHKVIGEFSIKYFKSLLKNSPNQNDIELILEKYTKMFESKSGVENFILPEIPLLCSLYGGVYDTKDTIYSEVELPNPLSNHLLVSKSEFYNDYIDEKFVSFYNNYYADQNSYIEMVKSIYNDDDILTEEINKIQPIIIFTNYFSYHLPYGIPADFFAGRLIKIIDEKGILNIKETTIDVEMLYDED